MRTGRGSMWRKTRSITVDRFAGCAPAFHPPHVDFVEEKHENPGMSKRMSVFTFAVACLLAHVASAQAQAPTPDPVGVWRGTSLCRVRPSPCKDENVVYRITRVNASDTLSIDARKIVNGQE